MLGGFDAVQDGHVNVHQNEIEWSTFQYLKGLDAALDQLHVLNDSRHVQVEHPRQYLEVDGIVVDQQDVQPGCVDSVWRVAEASSERFGWRRHGQ